MNVDELFSRAYDQFQKKEYDAALKTLDELQKLAPNFRNAYCLEGEIWAALNNPVKEFHAFRKVLPFLEFSSPEEKDFSARVLSHLGGICNSFSLLEEAVKLHRLSVNLFEDKKEAWLSIEAAIIAANVLENFSAAEYRALYDEFKKYLADIKPYPRKFYSHKKIRVGFLSANFRDNVVVNWSWSLLTNLDKNFFETYFYSARNFSDVVTEHLRKISDGWRDIYDLTDEVVAKLIRDDEIDILFDFDGHTRKNRLQVAAYCPASVNMSGVGYMNSTGLECVDYFLSDVYCAGDENYFTEKLIKLPHSHICYEPSTKLEPANSPPCLKNNFVTFGSFNQFSKVTDSILIAWKKILDAVPNSRLLLKHKIFDTENGKEFVGKRMKNFGFDLARIEMRPFTDIWLNEYADMDIALDTFPYTGGVTTCEALYMGVPVVSLYGDRHGSRFGLSILSNVGLEELAVSAYDEYINRAVMLANDWELLALLRKNLRTMMRKSPLVDSENYLREIQSAFIKILDDERKNFLSTKG